MKRIMKGVVKPAILTVFAVLLAGCGQSLWYSGAGRSADFTIALSLPTPDELTPVGRALALQGNALYLEIASITDMDMYTNPDGDGQTEDSLFYSTFDSNGEWVETDWGGYAARQISTTGISPITAGFTGIPTDKNLMVRVIQDTDGASIKAGLPNYLPGDGYEPISQTYNPDGQGPWGELGVRITPSQLKKGFVDLPIRPHPYVIRNTYTITPGQWHDSMIAATGVPPYRPASSGETEFSEIYLDMADEPFNDPAMLVGTQMVVTDGTTPPGIVHAFDKTGRRLPLVINRSESQDGETTYYYFGFAKVDLDSQFGSNSDYFLGVTVRPGAVLDGSDPDIIEYDLLAVPLVNAYIDSYAYTDQFGDLISHSVDWDMPYLSIDALRYGDLEYKVVHWYGANLPPQSVYYDIDGLMSMDPQVVMDWSNANEYFYDNGETSGYYIPDIRDMPGVSWNPQELDSYVTAVMARFPGGRAFLIAVDTGAYYSQTPAF